MKRPSLLVVILAFFVVLVVAAVGVIWWLWQPSDSSVKQTKSFIVSQNETSTEIATQLTQAGFIKSPLIFKIEVRREDVDQKLKAGSFDLSPSMTVPQIVQVLANNPSGVWVTVPEGKRREEVAAILADTKLENFKSADFIAETADQEGYLFPDTYLLPREATSGAIIKTMSATFDQKVRVGLADEVAASGHPLADVITMASIVQREAKSYADMQTVAGVLWKRISIGMPLQSDVTVEYLHGYDPTTKSWWGTSTATDRQSDSPFNTYIAIGLPPHPIANPGLDAIKATLDPTQTDALFYLSDQQGNIHTAKTLQEQDANIQKYLE